MQGHKRKVFEIDNTVPVYIACNNCFANRLAEVGLAGFRSSPVGPNIDNPAAIGYDRPGRFNGAAGL